MLTTLKIGDAARQTGLTVDAIRFYQREGLLRQRPRTEGGFRLFAPEDIQNLLFIRRTQALGFSLAEVREILVLENGQPDVCTHVQDLLQNKLRVVLAKIAELRELEQRLSQSLRRCKRELAAKGRAEHKKCPFLAEIKNNGKGAR